MLSPDAIRPVRLYRAIKTVVECARRLNGGKLDMVEQVEERARMGEAWAERRRVLEELEG